MKNLIRYCAASALCIMTFSESICAGVTEAFLDLTQTPPKWRVVFTSNEGDKNNMHFEAVILSHHHSKDNHTITLQIPSEMLPDKENLHARAITLVIPATMLPIKEHLEHNTIIKITSKIQSSAKEAKNMIPHGYRFTDNAQQDTPLTNALGHNSNSYPNTLWMSNRAAKMSERMETSPDSFAPQTSNPHDLEAYPSRLYLSYRDARGNNIWE